MIFYDMEVFKYNWLIKALDMNTRKWYTIWDDKDALMELYDSHKKDIWSGFNINHYDQYIFKSILLNIDPFYVSCKIVKEHLDGWQITNKFRQFPMINYDVFISRERGLKLLEGFMGSNIKESDVDFEIDRPLTDEEKAETEKYCTHDVEEAINVFMHQINEFEAAMGLIQMFPNELSLMDLSRTKAQMSAKIIGCERVHDRDDEFDVFILDCIQLSKDLQPAAEFFLNPDNHWYKNGTKKNEFKIIAAGLEHTLGWGGIHAAREKYHNNGIGCQMWHIDVASFYPRLMIYHGLLTRNSNHPEKFKEIFDERLRLKAAGKKKEQAPLKIVINSTYGASKDKSSAAYDPRQANLICLNGQLMLLDLIDHLNVIPGFELIQSNTDGLIVSIPDDDESFDKMDDICYEWEQRCNMELEFDEIASISQKDVNNYVCKFANGKLERKGAYVKELGPLDYDLPIVNEAIVLRLSENIPVEETILKCDEFIKFQKVVKLTGKYEYVTHNDRKYTYKCYRVFASKDSSDGSIFKVKNKPTKDVQPDGTFFKLVGEKFANTPESCFIFNDKITDLKVPENLDKQWYIDLARKRLTDFGIY